MAELAAHISELRKARSQWFDDVVAENVAANSHTLGRYEATLRVAALMDQPINHEQDGEYGDLMEFLSNIPSQRK